MLASVVSRALFLFFCTVWAAAACDQIPAGEAFWIRLVEPISSFKSKPGTPVRAIIAESPQCGGAPMFSRGTEVEGIVKSVASTGLGFRHETARLTLQFGRLIRDPDRPIEFRARVIDVANARESVKDGVIHGIQSTNTPQGRITSRLKHLPTWNPYSDWVLIVYRLAFPVSPEPEIFFPTGTDLQLQLAAPLAVAEPPAAPPNRDFASSDTFVFNELVDSLPERTATPKGRDADIVNLMFIGTRQQLETAFQRAGWVGSDPASKRAVLRQFHAFITLNSYSRAPISKQLYQGQSSDSTWEKSLNSYGKRDHLRIWSEPQTWQGQPIWVAASSHESQAVLSFRRGKFLHHVDANLDAERDKVVRDLDLAGCVDALHGSPRPWVPELSLNPTGDELRTNGTVAVVRLKDCSSESIFSGASDVSFMPSRPGNRFTRYIRTQVLSFRSDVWRGNIIHGGFDVGRMAIAALHRKYSRNYNAKRVSTTPKN